jgi:hypothetical protein
MGLGGIYNIAFVSFDLTGGPKLSKIVSQRDYECFNLADI